MGCVANQMKMPVRYVLMCAAVGDETVAATFKMMFTHQVLYGHYQVVHEIGRVVRNIEQTRK